MPKKTESGLFDKFKAYKNIAELTRGNKLTPVGFNDKIKRIVKASLKDLIDWAGGIAEAIANIGERLTMIETSISTIPEADDIPEPTVPSITPPKI